MEPQHNYKQQWSTGLEASSFEQGKINTLKAKSAFTLNIVLQSIIVFLSIIYLLTSMAEKRHVLLINMLLINILFFVSAWLPQNKIRGSRKILYSCLIFASTLILLFSSLLTLTGDLSALGSVIMAWGIIIVSNIIIFFLMTRTK